MTNNTPMSAADLNKLRMKQIANMIYAQLGGNKFAAMTGAHSFAFGNDGSLSFKYPAKGRALHGVLITLNGNDLYDVKFIVVNKDYNVKEYENVYEDQLAELFTRHTGLLTSL